jgi:hypothetical protein
VPLVVTLERQLSSKPIFHALKIGVATHFHLSVAGMVAHRKPNLSITVKTVVLAWPLFAKIKNLAALILLLLEKFLHNSKTQSSEMT